MEMNFLVWIRVWTHRSWLFYDTFVVKIDIVGKAQILI